jgi:hypothetical protein
MTLGSEVSSDQQFEIRRKRLGRCNEWVVLVPYFTEDLSGGFQTGAGDREEQRGEIAHCN